MLQKYRQTFGYHPPPCKSIRRFLFGVLQLDPAALKNSRTTSSAQCVDVVNIAVLSNVPESSFRLTVFFALCQ